LLNFVEIVTMTGYRCWVVTQYMCRR